MPRMGHICTIRMILTPPTYVDHMLDVGRYMEWNEFQVSIKLHISFVVDGSKGSALYIWDVDASFTLS